MGSGAVGLLPHEFRRVGGGLDIMCCKAGIMNLPDKATADGFGGQLFFLHHFLFFRTGLRFR